ncbi:MAG: 2,3-bisphosphoglycerate-independent phosphoglycerate mutase [Candidatus Falkowbacteria bacterium]|nr:2,3-bisphosphoglycerate-independent phosphoglycerate mutase [Candidatus Falkowbacteria bacterium]
MLPLILIILDGWGMAKPNRGNAITLAKTPFIDSLFETYPHTQIFAHGSHVGLPPLQDGNSEAGHMNMGAGRIIEQEAVRINTTIKNGLFFKNSALLKAINHAKRNKSYLHIMGLASGEMSPHSNPKHLKALIKLIKQENFKNYYLHLFTDGRDSSPRGGLKFISDIEKDLLKKTKRISTIMGRYYGMDRKKKWENTELAYNALVLGEGLLATNPQNAIKESYSKNITDEFIEPYIITDKKKMLPRIDNNDAVIFFNLRSDRARQLTKCFAETDFTKKNPGSFKKKKTLKNICFVALTDFGPDLDTVKTAFPGAEIEDTLPLVLKKYSQLYVAEKEKYAHVTYFFNGGYNKPLNGEKWEFVPSPNKKHYDEVPEMSSKKLTKIILNNFKHKAFKLTPQKNSGFWHYDLTVINFAAPDMIGHTGNLKAGITCCEAIDRYIKEIVNAYLKADGTIVITADHGNIEEMINLKTGEIDTKHSTNLVPFIIINKNLKNRIKLKKNGKLGDIAPTIIHLLGEKKPKSMTGVTLIEKI